MPLGWYLAQGLIPLGESSSDDEEGPCELPDGRTVCGPHGLVCCHKCCSDYSILNEDLENNSDDYDSETVPDEDDAAATRANTQIAMGLIRLVRGSPPPMDLLGTPKRRGTGRVFPTEFVVPDLTIAPFESKQGYGNLTRLVGKENHRQLFLFTDGACLNNGQPNPKAGWAFLHGPSVRSPTGELIRPALVESGRLEQEGPFGDAGLQTSNRAELRAVIAALRFRAWHGEGFKSLIIGTDSEYVVHGATRWAKGRVRKGWKTKVKAEVKNRDLWEMLLGEVERASENQLEIQLWWIPRAMNAVVDAAAKKAAEGGEIGEWTDRMGICV